MPALIPLLFDLVREGPAMIAFAESTYALFASGKLSEAELQALWTDATARYRAASAKWEASKSGPAGPAP